jgi:iron complex outermembrane recepter protein
MQASRKRATGLKYLLLASAAFSASIGSALAQSAPQQDQDVVVVTGTRIAQEGYSSSSPIATVGAAELERQQPVDVETVLRGLPQFAPGNGAQVNNGSAGVSTIDLRGLTTPRTLPLIDGKRMVPFDQNGLFDVTSIPLALLERVEVVTGGASAVYGSDAVAGVVNFILNDEFTGAQLDTNYSITDHGDGETESIQGTLGAAFDDGRGNVVFSMGYLNREPVFQTRGPGSATPGSSSTTTPAAIDTGGAAGRVQFSATGNLVPFYQGFDFNPQNYYQTPQKRWNATALAKYKLNDQVEAYSRFIYAKSSASPQIASSGTFGFSFEVPLTSPFLNAQAAGVLRANSPVAACSVAAAGDCATVGVRWRGVALGARESSYDYNTFQGLVGFRGDFQGWDWDVSAAHGETTLARAQNNDIDSDRFQQALFARNATTCFDTSNLCSPINIFNPAVPVTGAAAQFVSLNLQVQALTTQDYITAYASRDLGNFKSPFATRPIAVSVGAEYRDEAADYRPDAASQSGLSPGFGQTNPTRGRYDVFEQFVEGIVPLVDDQPFAKSINLEVGFRNSNYSTSGVTESYKYGADWTPFEGLRFRGMFQRAVRAANISELFAPVTPGTGDLLVDPCVATATNPVTGQLRALCIATGVPVGSLATLEQPTAGQVNSFFGGNPGLTPEEADTTTFGFVWQPTQLPRLGVTVDYYKIEIANAISIRPNFDIVDGCYNLARNTTASAANADCRLIARNTANGSIEGDLVFGIQQVTRNIGSVNAEGVDYSIRYDWDLGQWGGIDASLDGTYAIDASYTPSNGAGSIQCVGSYGKQCGLPSTVTGSTGGPTSENRFVQRTTWSYGDFDVSYLWRYLQGVDVDATQAADTDPESASIDDVSYIDLAASWQIRDWAKLKFSVTNVFDEEAPFVATETGSTASNSGNTYPSTYDSLGRVFSLGLTAKF